HGDVLMWLMKTLLTSRCVNQRGAGQHAPAPVVSDKQNLRVFSATPDARARTCARGRGRAIQLREGQP
ncbi:hypothetical protein EHJ16_17915, partial [Cronobacter dublinensis]|nr:hypothetical protein [Cronobacter dublinensis]